MAAVMLPIDVITSDPSIRGGRPVIAGTGIRVSDIVASYLYRSTSVDDLAVQYPLTLAQVHSALAYYYLHKDAIDFELRRNAEEAESLLAALDGQGKLTRLAYPTPLP